MPISCSLLFNNNLLNSFFSVFSLDFFELRQYNLVRVDRHCDNFEVCTFAKVCFPLKFFALRKISSSVFEFWVTEVYTFGILVLFKDALVFKQ